MNWMEGVLFHLGETPVTPLSLVVLGVILVVTRDDPRPRDHSIAARAGARATVRVTSTLTLLLIAGGCAGAPTAWPPPLPSDVAIEPDEPREITITAAAAEVVLDDAPAIADVPVGPETSTRDGDVVEVIEGELEGLRYLEMIFGEANVDDPLPTIWVLHGRGDRAGIPGGPFWDLPMPVRIFVPQAPDALGAGFSWLPYRVAEGRTLELSDALREMARRLARLIGAFTLARPTVGRPIVTGFSQGGLLAFAIALLHPESASFALPNAGWLPPPLVPDLSDPSRFPVVRAQHGTEDERIPIGPTRELVAQLRAAGLDVELIEALGAGHAMSPEMDQTFRGWLIAALGSLTSPTTDGADPSNESPGDEAQVEDAAADP